MGGVLARYPNLRVGFLEAGTGWLPFWLERLDEHWEHVPDQAPEIDRAPSRYFLDGNCYVTCEPDEMMVPYVMREMRPDVVCYASDYCHWDCVFPDSVRVLAERDDLEHEEKERVFARNAAALYGLGVPALRSGTQPALRSGTQPAPVAVIVDTHTHVVALDRRAESAQPAGVGSDWFRDAPVPVEQLARETAAAGVGAVVLVQAFGAYSYDNSYVVDAAAHDLGRFVSIGIVDAEDPATPGTLRELATRPGFTGIRLFPLGDPSRPQPEWLDDPRTFPVWETCAELGLRVVVAMLPVQFPRLRRMLDRFPDQAIVLDHCGFADVTGGAPYGKRSVAARVRGTPQSAPEGHIDPCSESAELGGHDSRRTSTALRRRLPGADHSAGWGLLLPFRPVTARAQAQSALGRHACERLSAEDADRVLGGTALRLWPEFVPSGETAS